MFSKIIEDTDLAVLSAKKGKENVILYVKDNGIGIKESEIGRVFEKGFTGTNGRTINKKSTGIGLYLSKKLCNKLGIGIEIDSKINEGTEVKLIFPKGSYNLDWYKFSITNLILKSKPHK